MLAALVLVGFLALVVAGMPVFAAMGIGAVAGMLLIGETDALARNLAFTISQAFTGFVLVAVPLYILVGTLMEEPKGTSEKDNKLWKEEREPPHKHKQLNRK